MRVASGSDAQALADAARLLAAGSLVVIPTETVYGLAANALDEAAVRAIFAAKGRPSDNPVIVHVADEAAARALANGWPEAAAKAAAAFWPGPLTLVVGRAKAGPKRVADAATGGLDTVAVRVPAHPVALEVLRQSGIPLAAPSANRSGRPSPTRVQDALADLGDAVALYLDGGPTQVGLESTVLDVTTAPPTVLRPGGVSRERLEAVLGPVATLAPGPAAVARSPGTKYRHYAPRTPLEVCTPQQAIDRHGRAEAGTAFLVSAETAAETNGGMQGPNVHVVAGRADAAAWARRLFALLRDLDSQGYARLVVEAIPPGGLADAVLDRLRRAAER